MTESGEITTLLAAMRDGDREALDRLLPLVYRELRERAHRQLGRRAPGETISTTALVHEAYLKLAGSDHQSYNDRVHFFAVASRAMRQILVDYARQAATLRRGGNAVGAPVVVDLDPDRIADAGRAEELIELDEALAQLERLDERLARTVELRFFGGLSVEEAAEVLAVSPRTVKRDWRKARAFLYNAIRDAEPGSDS